MVVPRLKSSMKSFVKVAPEFPPPPYTWLTTRFVLTAPAGCTSRTRTVRASALSRTRRRRPTTANGMSSSPEGWRPERPERTTLRRSAKHPFQFDTVGARGGAALRKRELRSRQLHVGQGILEHVLDVAIERRRDVVERQLDLDRRDDSERVLEQGVDDVLDEVVDQRDDGRRLLDRDGLRTSRRRLRRRGGISAVARRSRVTARRGRCRRRRATRLLGRGSRHSSSSRRPDRLRRPTSCPSAARPCSDAFP